MKTDFEKIARGENVANLSDGGTRGRGCAVEWHLDAPSTAVTFDEDCIRCVEESAAELFGERASALTPRMISGAGTYLLSLPNGPTGTSVELTNALGHDSVFTSKRCPTSMIFVGHLSALSTFLDGL